MSNFITLARPYAKAVFSLALQRKNMVAWSNLLNFAKIVVNDKRAKALLENPTLSPKQQFEWISNICTSVLFAEAQSLFRLLASRRRLVILSDIADLFEMYRTEQEKIVNVKVTSALPLKSLEKDALVKSLGARLQREVTLEYREDASLLGGVIIKANDFVIDDSIRSKLERLATTLID